MKKEELDLVVAQAKGFGDNLWASHTKKLPRNKELPATVYNDFATRCEQYFNASFFSAKENNLRIIEAFLRCGKHLPEAVKVDNRKKADKLYDEILKESK